MKELINLDIPINLYKSNAQYFNTDTHEKLEKARKFWKQNLNSS